MRHDIFLRGDLGHFSNGQILHLESIEIEDCTSELVLGSLMQDKPPDPRSRDCIN